MSNEERHRMEVILEDWTYAFNKKQ